MQVFISQPFQGEDHDDDDDDVKNHVCLYKTIRRKTILVYLTAVVNAKAYHISCTLCSQNFVKICSL